MSKTDNNVKNANSKKHARVVVLDKPMEIPLPIHDKNLQIASQRAVPRQIHQQNQLSLSMPIPGPSIASNIQSTFVEKPMKNTAQRVFVLDEPMQYVKNTHSEKQHARVIVLDQPMELSSPVQPKNQKRASQKAVSRQIHQLSRPSPPMPIPGPSTASKIQSTFLEKPIKNNAQRVFVLDGTMQLSTKNVLKNILSFKN
ncbi:hypothetical protein QAD02_013396 [Eretmocerus hayati]|uniref:Uncharacterized protein n=1 Tax=Eretmocerus hayati TaxID=131215 RepID=A0ACC2P2R5_9HYME|nr:hypothetical protein QAD02_013396 [Eretmocerus hayati]